MVHRSVLAGQDMRQTTLHVFLLSAVIQFVY
jgi:hypothetical protein